MEKVRRPAAWLAGALFATSFVVLLVLSATSYWRPDNALLRVVDQLWKVSGVVFLLLTALPYAVGLFRRASGAPSA